MRKPQTKYGPKAEMNVVPYIDVMLVLLVIFMVTTPMLLQGVQLDLPKVANEAIATNEKQKILTLSVQANGNYYWNVGTDIDTTSRSDSAVDIDEMASKVGRIIAEHGDTKVLVRADKSADYATVIAGIAALQRGGVTNLGLITEAPQ
ncbi:protein TolR [Herminiimonas sp. KBW02]|uniref:protein TolR n=1 Tax=Herminiimonas sp. KBW02 TaxID=2153363 RepID=UPI000F594445|nr:protein TolR [Herminiimonas sp. KBW02]RQO33936.1 protein TolR [Herminiimonas sp. KBW02]